MIAGRRGLVLLVALMLPGLALASPRLAPSAPAPSDPLREDLVRAREQLQLEHDRLRYHVPATLIALGVASLGFGLLYPNLSAEGRVGPLLVGGLTAGAGAALLAYTAFQKNALAERIEDLDRKLQRMGQEDARAPRGFSLRVSWRF